LLGGAVGVALVVGGLLRGIGFARRMLDLCGFDDDVGSMPLAWIERPDGV